MPSILINTRFQCRIPPCPAPAPPLSPHYPPAVSPALPYLFRSRFTVNGLKGESLFPERTGILYLPTGIAYSTFRLDMWRMVQSRCLVLPFVPDSEEGL